MPVARHGAADLLVGIELVDLGQLFVGVPLGHLRLDFGVLGPLLTGDVSIGAEAPAVRPRHELAVLVVEVHVIDLLDGPAGERRLVRDQLLQPRLGGNGVVAAHWQVPVPVRAGPHGVHAGQAAHVAGDDAARGEEEARRRDDSAVTRAGRVVWITPQRIVVANPVRVVTDTVARGLVAPRLEGIGDLDADAPAQVIERVVGDLGEQVGRFGGHRVLLVGG